MTYVTDKGKVIGKIRSARKIINGKVYVQKLITVPKKCALKSGDEVVIFKAKVDVDYEE